MEKYRSIDIDAGELVRNLGQLGELRAMASLLEHESIGSYLGSNELRILWLAKKSTNSELPVIILGTGQSLSKFLPKILALPSAVTPFSSLVHVWNIEDLNEKQLEDEDIISNAATFGFVGLIMGELMTKVGPDTDLNVVGMDGVRRTLSFVCAQAVIRGWRDDALTNVVRGWLEASALTANEVNVEDLIGIADLCGFLQHVSSFGNIDKYGPSDLADWIESWTHERNKSDQRDLLSSCVSRAADALTNVRGREERYDIVMDALENLSADVKLASLEKGFLISLIEPGSFEFIELAKKIDRGSGAVVPAYYVCAAILGKESMLGRFNGFGRVVINRGFNPDFEVNADISLIELRILYDKRRSSPVLFRTRSPWLIDVEIVPMVVGSFGNMTKRKISSQKSVEDKSAMERDKFLRKNLADAMQSIENAYAVIAEEQALQNEKSGSYKKRKGRIL